MTCRGIRGAVCAESNRPEPILSATTSLLKRIVAVNELSTGDLVSAIFTATPDLDAIHPARAAREIGWTHVPLLCLQEMVVEGCLERCIRVLIHWNTDRPPEAVRHVYLGKARALRPDLAAPFDGGS